MRSRVLLVVPVQTYRAGAFLRAAHSLGVSVTVASEVASTLAGLHPASELIVDLADPKRAAERAAAFASTTPIDGVVGVDEGAVVAAAAIALRLGLRHSLPEAVAATRDKRLLRRRLAAAGVPQPVFTTWPHPSGDPKAVGAATGFPCVVKPVDQAGSRGVIRADDPPGLLAAVRRVLAMLEGDRAAGRCAGVPDPPLLIERFVPGPEVALEGLVVGGRLRTLAIFDKPDPLDGPTFEETLYCTPSRHAAAVQLRLRRVAGAAVRALGLTEGPIHAELRLAERGPVVLEVAARTIGGQCSAALRLAGGESLEALVLRHALGWRPLGARLDPLAAGACMWPIPRAGRVVAVEGLEAARRVPGVEAVRLAVPIGAAVRPLPEGDRYLGFAIARATDPALVEAALRRVLRLIRVRISPDAGPAGGRARRPRDR